ncbi:Protein of uncharacterised function (DUF2974) [Actinomyces bovis]|uniref:Protein of uncharacterized function (DUF2974) n=1 Tax=Actinomyces bovis TaxID=1658 RepID=A0ABY1VL42_9ACTO|nr:DUF2974 domain-containing protein [Actinomyces bovis]SPT52819.1 Protein of uncharacterised function (DUF2974) [Actinomyces bovis]VEG54877.1 Protein of uncharacterised function (DUF2974) [Actinomyces israelii]
MAQESTPPEQRPGTLLSYVRRRLETFSQRGLCPVDSLVLSCLAYTQVPPEAELAGLRLRDWEGVPLRELYRAEYFQQYYAGLLIEPYGLRLLAAAAASPRFRDLLVRGYREHTDHQAQEQFAAVTFQVEPGLHFVAYRGTDASLVGWKESFNLSFCCPVPAQSDAAAYLEEVAQQVDGELVVGGHSKGGNLAVYAAACAPGAIQERIKQVFSHDGPGFLPEFLETDAYARVAEKTSKTVPQASVVGLLLEDRERHQVVRSKNALIWQHDPFSWVVEGCDFAYLDSLAPSARLVSSTVSAWLRSRSAEERERFINTLYAVLETAGAQSTQDLREGSWRNAPAVARAFAGLDPETRSFTLQTLAALLPLGIKAVPGLGKSATGSPA